MQSIVQERGRVTFPPHIGERVYMREFYKQDGLPSDLHRWQTTVDAMLDGVDTDGPIYLMVDQGEVRAGKSQRRPGVHMDGYWNPVQQCHDVKPTHVHHATTWPSEGLILASTVTACRAFEGEWTGTAGAGGDCSHVDTSGMKEIVLGANRVYAGNVTMLHESLPVGSDCVRTVVRLNVPGWEPRWTKNDAKNF